MPGRNTPKLTGWIVERMKAEGEGTPVPPDLPGLSICIEHVDDLIGDLDAAIDG